MVTRLIIADSEARVRFLADWQHPDRLEPFILGNLLSGGIAYAVTIRTAAHFADDIPPTKRTAAHESMLRQARECAVREFLGSAHRIMLDCTRGGDGQLYAHAAYAVRVQENGIPNFASQIAMPDVVIDGKPRPLFRRIGDQFQRWSRGTWAGYESDHTRHQIASEQNP